ncbi:glucokinase [Candidatus Woesearchaeota archaeon]|nr:glucokinase [Candidatus Woesearchaeota archaeon]
MLSEVFRMPEKDFDKSKYRFFTIVADVGGTNSYFAVMGVRDNKNYDIILKEKTLTLHLKEIYTPLNDILKKAYETYSIEVGRACISAAGPVSRRRGHIDLTNAGLQIKRGEILSKTLLKKVILINDFEAIGFGIDHLDLNKDVMELKHTGDLGKQGWVFSNTCAVIGAGTGLGTSVVYYDYDTHLHTPLPSEGGHMDLPAHDEFEFDLVQFLKKKVLKTKDAHPEFERVLSGQGLHNIYNFLKSRRGFKPTATTRKLDKLEGNVKLEAIDDNYGKDKTCTQTIDLFVKFYARAAKNLALISECYSGLFIAGRITLRNKDAFTKGDFMKEFEKHEKETGLLKKIPVFIITNTDVSLYGCCNVLTNFYSLS